MSKPGYKPSKQRHDSKSTFRFNFDDEAYADCVDDISDVLEKHSSSFSEKSKSSSTKFREVANRCRSNSIMEEPRAIVKKFNLPLDENPSSTDTPDTSSVFPSEELSSVPITSDYGTCSENGVCSSNVFYSGNNSRQNTVSSNRTAHSLPKVTPMFPDKKKRSSVTNSVISAAADDDLDEAPPRKIHRSFSVPNTREEKSNIRAVFPNFKRFTNTKMRVVQKTVSLRKEKVKAKKMVPEKIVSDNSDRDYKYRTLFSMLYQ